MGGEVTAYWTAAIRGRILSMQKDRDFLHKWGRRVPSSYDILCLAIDLGRRVPLKDVVAE